ncbi:MAG TPA: ATP-NAD kinase family protein [Bacillota bacterium]|nr:ATP-NAD kinase family protein [Bacillota bacterium]
MKTIGLIINPIAGMGGRVGLKGTDGADILNKAIRLGALKEAPNTALGALRKLEPLREELRVLTASGDMGENQCRALGFRHEVVYQAKALCGSADTGGQELESGALTDSGDTEKAAGIMAELGTELILFAGGDGTARDIYRAVGTTPAVLGIPAGVKIYSPVYGNSPRAAGELACRYLCGENLPLKEEEVVDVDEDAVRGNRVITKLYGYLKVPFQREYLQNKKAPTPLSEAESRMAIALDVVDHMEKGKYYLIGPGTTAGAVMEALGLPNTLLGVDIIRDKALVKADCGEKDILDILGDEIGQREDKASYREGGVDAGNGEGTGKLVIAPTGGQGYLLGRGNQQISPEVLRRIGKENIIILSVNSKIIDLQGSPLLVDVGDEAMNRKLEGYYRVKVGYGVDIMYRISEG